MSVHVVSRGNLGNRAIQYLVAKHISTLSGSTVISNVDLPEWGLTTTSELPNLTRSLHFGLHNHWVDIEGAAYCLNREIVDHVVLDSYAQHIENLPSREESRTFLPSSENSRDFLEHRGDILLCSVRGGEILRAAHPHYVVLPYEFYRKIAEIYNKNIVFYGQIEDNSYIEELARALPDAKFVAGRNPIFDFEVLRRARNVVLAISTFAWLAAWLGEADRVIVPIAGLFHPLLEHTDFLPVQEDGFDFFRFAPLGSVDLFGDALGFFNTQRRLARSIERCSAEAVGDLKRAGRANAPPRVHLTGFDPERYLKERPEVARNLEAVSVSAATHFLLTEHAGREPNRASIRRLLPRFLRP